MIEIWPGDVQATVKNQIENFPSGWVILGRLPKDTSTVYYIDVTEKSLIFPI